MNERIEELAVQAGLIAKEYNGFDRTVLTPAEKKFAEMILAECLVTLDSITSGDRDTLWVARKVLADHFGVK